MFRRLLLCICCLLMVCSVWAELLNGGAMNNLTVCDGIAGMTVSDVILDKDGIIWMATSNGVCSYNGKKIVTYRMLQDNIASNFCYKVALDDKGTVYAATRGGLFALKKGNNDFVNIVPDKRDVETVLTTGNEVYFGNNQGLFAYTKKELRKINLPDGIIKNYDVSGLRSSARKEVVFASKNVLYKYMPKVNKVKKLILNLPSEISAFDIYNNKIILGTRDAGLYVYDKKKLSLSKMPGVGNIITSVQVVSNRYIYVGTDGAGAFVIDGASMSIVEHYGTDESGDRHLPHNAIYCFYHDRNGVDWFGINRYGVCYNFHSDNLFNVYHYKDFTTRGLEVRSYLIDNKVRIIGTFLGLYYIDEGKKTVRYFSPKEIGANIVTCICKYNGLYYIGTFDGGLLQLNPKTMSISHVQGNVKFKNTPFVNLTISPDGKLWASSYSGLFIFDRNGKQINHTTTDSGLRDLKITSTEFDGLGNCWITSSDGISKYLANKNIIRNDIFPRKFFNNEKWLKVIKGHDGYIYAYGIKSIYYTNPSMSKFGEITLPKGILDESCNSFIDDGKGYYWIGSEKGLFRMNYEKNRIVHFGFGEGLNSLFISYKSINVVGHDSLWVGTSDGLMTTSFTDLKKWETRQHYKIAPYNVTVDGFLVGNGAENMMISNKSLSISWNFVSQTVQFMPILLDYSRTGNRYYQYKMDKDTAWNLVSDDDFITLHSLSLGKHNVYVRLAGAKGTETVFSIYVAPSLPFYIELFLFVVALCLFLWWYNYHKRTNILLAERDTIEQTLIEEEMARHTQEELNESGGDDAEKHKIKINVKDAELIISQLKEYMENETPYLNPDLKMSDIASVLKVSQSLLSAVFSQYLNNNYYDYINSFRLEEFKKYISDGKYKHYTLTALSEKCGFKKTSFFTTFRKVEGMTPAEYIQKHRR